MAPSAGQCLLGGKGAGKALGLKGPEPKFIQPWGAGGGRRQLSPLPGNNQHKRGPEPFPPPRSYISEKSYGGDFLSKEAFLGFALFQLPPVSLRFHGAAFSPLPRALPKGSLALWGERGLRFLSLSRCSCLSPHPKATRERQRS